MKHSKTRWESLTGKTIGRCRIAEQIGAGGMGAVFRATHLALKIPVAVKFLLMDDADPQAAGTARFVREAQLAATLRHPNIVRIYDVNSEGDLHFIIMELLPGKSLAQVLHEEGALALDRARSFGAQIADALSHAHTRGVIHRDIKPDNVMVADDGVAVLTDFGIAAPEGVSRLTPTGLVVGTAWYIAPEQATGGQADSRADLYALGVLLYEMLTGRLPFDGDTAIQQISAKVTGDPIPLTRWRKDIPAELVGLIGRLLTRDPEGRVQRAEDVLDGLLVPTPRSSVSSALGSDLANAPTLPMVAARTAELQGLVASAGVPMDPVDPVDLIDLRVADVWATALLAEALSEQGPRWLMVHREGVADIIGLDKRSVLLAMRVIRGIASGVGAREVLVEAMKRPNGAITQRSTEEPRLSAMRSWLDGVRVLGPVPAEIVNPTGLFARFLRSQLSGVLAVTDRSQTTLASFEGGSLAAMYCPKGHAMELAELTQHDLGEWMNSLSPEAQTTFNLTAPLTPDAEGQGAAKSAMKAALKAASEALSALATEGT